MNEAVDARFGASQGERPGRLDAIGLEFPPPSPIADLRSAVENQPGPRDGCGTCGGIGQVASRDIGVDAFKEFGWASGPDQHAKAISPCSEPLGQMAAEKPSRSGNKDAIAGSGRILL
jgi:hypothetical protein